MEEDFCRRRWKGGHTSRSSLDFEGTLTRQVPTTASANHPSPSQARKRMCKGWWCLDFL